MQDLEYLSFPLNNEQAFHRDPEPSYQGCKTTLREYMEECLLFLLEEDIDFVA